MPSNLSIQAVGVNCMNRTLIQNALIYDGSGQMPYTGDILFRDSTIEAIGRIPCCDAQVIPANGRAACPGFIDIHRHCDLKVFKEGFGELELCQGITTVLAGNCGLSPTPCTEVYEDSLFSYLTPILGEKIEGMHIETFPEYMERLSRVKLPLNFGAMIGTGSTRIAVKGFSKSPFSEFEMSQAQKYITEALTAGAFGVSMGIMYVPECYGTTEEFVQLVSPVEKYGGFVPCHMRGEAAGMISSVKELIEIGRRANVPVEVSHFKSVGRKHWGQDIYEAIELIEQARNRGQDITVDIYPYEAGSTTLAAMLPPSYVGSDMMGSIRRLNRPESVRRLREELSKEFDGWDNFALSLGWDRTYISSVASEKNRKYSGLSVTENVKRFGFRDEAEFVATLLYEEDGNVGLINMSMDQNDIDVIAKLPYSLFISDSIYANTNSPHPRLYGAFPKIIRDYVYERNLLSLSQAIHKMTYLPAQRTGIKDRGLLKTGYKADILLFEPEKLKDHATYTDPVQLSTGLDYSFINGRLAVHNGQVVSLDNGSLLKS